MYNTEINHQLQEYSFHVMFHINDDDDGGIENLPWACCRCR